MTNIVGPDGIPRPARKTGPSFFCKPPLKVVLVEPEIPPNTGNVARMCYATGTELHLIEPLSFSLDDKKLRRAGLDYWKKMKVQLHKSIDKFLEETPVERCYFLSTRAERPFWEMPIQPGDAIVFGKESTGLGPELVERFRDRLYHIPILPDTVRSINLSNAVAIVLYDSYRRIAGIK